ncbi:hypothetical protein DYB37_008446 [Aphanomyces astaci]|uniref:Uncharacterized protein n=1 Tax=Aphanomyces astaci TaxID=112090 RepID=A0A3R6XY32_APHAT|nr:hypothetical protein DYB37_008446 [Aphanomyces astaci]RHZ38283.1 hypothetical protein DYB26_013011 [Aphanomyces astaci]
MANTAARQVRYSATDSDNAAVYLETILRNARWSDIVHEYGDGDDGGSSIRRSRPASGSSGGGIDWLASVPDAFVDVVSEAELVAVQERHEVTAPMAEHVTAGCRRDGWLNMG